MCQMRGCVRACMHACLLRCQALAMNAKRHRCSSHTPAPPSLTSARSFWGVPRAASSCSHDSTMALHTWRAGSLEQPARDGNGQHPPCPRGLRGLCQTHPPTPLPVHNTGGKRQTHLRLRGVVTCLRKGFNLVQAAVGGVSVVADVVQAAGGVPNTCGHRLAAAHGNLHMRVVRLAAWGIAQSSCVGDANMQSIHATQGARSKDE